MKTLNSGQCDLQTDHGSAKHQEHIESKIFEVVQLLLCIPQNKIRDACDGNLVSVEKYL